MFGFWKRKSFPATWNRSVVCANENLLNYKSIRNLNVLKYSCEIQSTQRCIEAFTSTLFDVEIKRNLLTFTQTKFFTLRNFIKKNLNEMQMCCVTFSANLHGIVVSMKLCVAILCTEPLFVCVYKWMAH